MDQPLIAGRTRGQNAGKGILLMLLAMFLLFGMDALAKVLTATYPIPQVLWSRFFFHLAAMVVVMWHRLPVVATSFNRTFQIWRGITVVLTNAGIVTAMSFIPLAETAALSSASPLFVALLSARFLHEPVSRLRMISIAVGFVGVLIVIRPGAGVLHPAAFVALGAALLYAANQIIMRYLGGFDAPLTTVFFTALIGTAATSVIAPFVWVAPDLQGWAIMFAMGILSLTGQYVIVQAFSAAPAAIVSPFNYSGLIWAVAFGWLLFDDLPDLFTITGALVIVASGIAVVRSR